MRRCSDAIFEILAAEDLEAAVDIHNNTGLNPFYAIVPDPTQEALRLASALADTILRWPLRAHTLMEVLSPIERYGLVDDAWAAVVAGQASAGSYLDLVQGFADEYAGLAAP